MKTNKKTLTKIVMAALLVDISIILVYFVHFPMFLPFLEYDPADISILFGTLVYGPLFGFVLTVLTSLIQAVTVSAGSGLMGFIMHTVATGAMVWVAGLVYEATVRIDNTLGNDSKTFVGRRLIGLICSLASAALMAILIMIPLNLIVTPYFMGVSVETVRDLLIPAIIPFNAIKASVNCILAGVLYVLMQPLLAKMRIGKEYMC